MDFRVAVCSYKRYKSLGKKTLNTLNNNNIPKDIIDIFVNNQEEYDIYRPLYPEYNMIIGEVGMRQIRQFMFNYYKEGDKVWFMDDDICAYKRQSTSPDSSPFQMEHIKNLQDYLKNGFEYCEKENTVLFGINPVIGHRYMKDTITTKLMLCVGWSFGVIIDKEVLKLDERTKGNFEDFERTLKVFKKYNKVIRINNICASTPYACEDSGGMNLGDRSIGMKSDCDILMEMFPEYLYLKPKKTALIGVNPTIKNKNKYIL